MKKLNILICDSDNRDIMSLIYQYCKLGHNVLLPLPNTECFIEKTPLWPRLLLKSIETGERFIKTFGIPKYDECIFGEDRFLETEVENIKEYKSDVYVKFIDVSLNENIIDVFHTTPNTFSKLDIFFESSRKYFPHAKWISSCLTHFNHNLHNNPKNIFRYLPANYDNVGLDRNSFDFYRHPFEFEFLDVDQNRIEEETKNFSSFNHNFEVRHQNDYKMFCQLQKSLINKEIKLDNYGGNIRGQGADIKYSENNGLTGKFKTLSPKDAMKMNLLSKGVIHLKQYDWAGGVPAYARFAGAPFITTSKYINDTHSNNVLINNHNCLVGDSYEELISHIMRLNSDIELRRFLSKNMKQTTDNIFTENYWEKLNIFLEKLE